MDLFLRISPKFFWTLTSFGIVMTGSASVSSPPTEGQSQSVNALYVVQLFDFYILQHFVSIVGSFPGGGSGSGYLQCFIGPLQGLFMGTRLTHLRIVPDSFRPWDIFFHR